MSARRGALVAVAALAAVDAVLAAEAGDAAMRELARRAGCSLCHEVPARAGALNPRPLAPGWGQIAERYRGDPRAEERLTRTVLGGTGPLLSDRHWRTKVFFSEMPNNDVQISAAEARALVSWILGTRR